MTRTELLERARAAIVKSAPTFAAGASWTWRHRTLVLALAVGLLASLLSWSCHVAAEASARADAAAKRSSTETAAEAGGYEPIREAPQEQVDEEGEDRKSTRL